MRLIISSALVLLTLSLFITSGDTSGKYRPPGCYPVPCPYGKVFSWISCRCVRIEPKGCKWSPFGPWKYIDQCSKPCGGGYIWQRRTRTEEISHNPHDKCEGDDHEKRKVSCNIDPCECPYDKCCTKHGKWYWLISGRYYKCKVFPHGDIESKSCPHGYVFDFNKCDCVKLGCRWSRWGDWEYIDDHCSKTCGGGYRRKRRTRTKETSDNPHDKCDGDDHETASVPCNLDPCVHMCKETTPYAPANGYRRAGSATAPYYPGESITFKCNPCYELVGDDDDIECTYNGYWDSGVPTCRKIKCSLVEAPNNGYIKYADRYCGGKTKFACDEGYKLVGPAEIICLKSGEYNYDPPICVPVCPPGKCCENGKWFWRTEGRGYKCKVLSTGEIESKYCPYCQVFDDHVDKCKCVDAGIKCPPVQAPGCGVIVYADRNCGGRAKFACKPGCKLYGDPVITCKENGKYDSDPPKCIPDCRPEWGSWKKVYCGDCKRTGYGHNKQCSRKCTYERHCRPCGGYPGKRSTDDVELVRRGGGGGPSCHGDSKKYTTEPCGYCY